MNYVSISELKEHLNMDLDDTSSDAMLQAYISSTSRAIDTYCRRKFYLTEETKLFDAPQSTRNGPGKLWIHDDLHSVSSIAKSDGSIIDAASYWLMPQSGPPFGWIELRYETDRTLRWESSSLQRRLAISVTGQWGFVTDDALEQIAQACKLWTGHLIAKQDAIGISSKSIGDYSVSYTAGSEDRHTDQQGNLILMPPAPINMMLSGFRKRQVMSTHASSNHIDPPPYVA